MQIMENSTLRATRLAKLQLLYAVSRLSRHLGGLGGTTLELAGMLGLIDDLPH